jgi:hypothetical protein
MNGDTDLMVQRILAATGAIRRCPICKEAMVSSADEGAEEMACGIATIAWRQDECAFRGLKQEDVLSRVKSALAQAARCPNCGIGQTAA